MSSSNEISNSSWMSNFNLEELKNIVLQKMKLILTEELLTKIIHLLEKHIYKELACLIERGLCMEKDLNFSKFSCDILNEENDSLKAKLKKIDFKLEDKCVQTEFLISETVENCDASWTGVTDFEKEVEEVANTAIDYFDEKSGMYYDKKSNYFYCPNSGLYYDYKTGIYFYYNYESEEYEFHSQVDLNQEINDKASQLDIKSPKSSSSLEEGECDSDESTSLPISPLPVVSAPCLRLVVKEGDLKGQLFIVTICGGTIGTVEGQDVILNCPSVSRKHALISYFSEGVDDHHFYVKDNGSTNGTYVNSKLIKNEDCKPTEIGHGWELRIGDIVLGCHVHPGSNTCNECEPGLINCGKEKKKKLFKFNKEKERKRQMKILKKKAGLSFPAVRSEKALNEIYKDRASERRVEFGSDNPYEKTDVASINEEIRDNNVGYKMLKKMGWSKGEGLGSTSDGMKEPVIAIGVQRIPEKRKANQNSGSVIKKTFVKGTHKYL